MATRGATTKLNKTNTIKEALIIAMHECRGIVSDACLKVKISRVTYYQWLKDDAVFKEKIDDVRTSADDFLESKLLKLVENGDTAATIYCAKVRLKHRGYGPDRESAGENKVWEAPPPPNITFTVHAPTPPAQ